MKSGKRPARLALSNWPVRWKVLAIVVVPLALAGVFGGMRISSSAAAAVQLRAAAERADMVPTVVDYLTALENTMIAATGGGEVQDAFTVFDARKADLQQQLAGTEVTDSVRLAVNTLLDDGQDLLGKITGNAADLRTQVMTYAPLLIAAETAITGLVATDTGPGAADVRTQANALSRAVGARGQMVMQQILVTHGGDLPGPLLRSAMVTLAGTEPPMVSAMGAYLGGATDRAAELRSEMVKRMLVMSDPSSLLVGNPVLLDSQRITRGIADSVIAETVESIPAEVDKQADDARSVAIRDTALVVAAILITLLLVTVVARSLVLPLRTLRDSALKVAHDDLAREVEHVRGDGKPLPVRPIPVHTSEEIGQVAHAVDELHEQAVQLAGEQARLQVQMTDMFDTLSRRNQSLVDQQLALIDRLERNERDPDRLESLFQLDHLAAQMHRNGANLLVLAGARIPREQADPVPVPALVSAAASGVEDYTRVTTENLPDSEISGAVAGDLVHLLAELLDNALRYSPPTSQVTVLAVHTGSGGLVFEVADRGLGMTESDLRMANTRLKSGGEVNSYAARHMGLFVVGRLAAQHGLVVRLRSTVAEEPGSGTTAGVYIPAKHVVAWGADGNRVAATAEVALEHVEPAQPVEPVARSGVAAFFGPRPQPVDPRSASPPIVSDAPSVPPPGSDAPSDHPERDVDPDDAIYQKMRSEWLVDPHELSRSADLNWRTVWDHGWSAAEAADSVSVVDHTDEGLPVRQPGARLVPGGAQVSSRTPQTGGGRQ